MPRSLCWIAGMGGILLLAGMPVLHAQRIWWDTANLSGLQSGDGDWGDINRWSLSDRGLSHGARVPQEGDEVRFDAEGGGRIQIATASVGGVVVSRRGYSFVVADDGIFRIGRGGVAVSEEVLFRGPIHLDGEQYWETRGHAQLWAEGAVLWEDRFTTSGSGDFYFRGGRAASLSGKLLVHRGPGRLSIRGAHTRLKGLKVEGGVAELISNEWQDANVGGRIEVGPGATLEAATQTFGYFSIPLLIAGGEMVLTGAGIYVGKGNEGGGTVFKDAWVRDWGNGEMRLRGRIEMQREQEPVRVAVKTTDIFLDCIWVVDGPGAGVDAQVTTTLVAKEPRTLTKAGNGTLGIDGEIKGQLGVRIQEGAILFHGIQNHPLATWVVQKGASLGGHFEIRSILAESGARIGSGGLPYPMSVGELRMQPGAVLHIAVQGIKPGELHGQLLVETAVIEGAELDVSCSTPLPAGTRLEIIKGRVSGRFSGDGSVVARGGTAPYSLRIEYEDEGVYLIRD